MSSPNEPRSVRLLVLLRIRPFWWLVNQSTGFCSPRGILSTVTALIRSAFSDTKSPAFMNLDWSKADASRTIAVLLLFELRAVRVSAGSELIQFSFNALLREALNRV